MTFSYDASLSTDKDLVRFEIGDKLIEGHYLEDEEITAKLTSEASVGGAVVECIEYIITQLSQPNFKLDWLSVTNQEAKAGFEIILDRKRDKYGIHTTQAGVTVTATSRYRADSYQDDGDYDGAP